MTPEERAEARRVAAALLVAVIDEDTEGAEILLGNCSHQVLAQAATDLAGWLVVGAHGNAAELRDAVARQLQELRDD